MIETFHIQSPIGQLKVSISPIGLKSIQFVHDKSEKDDAYLSEKASLCTTQINEYFGGDRKSFSLPLDLGQLPPFYQEVLKMVCTIPYGKTRTYKQIAAVLGNSKSARAVGQANSKNPIPIVIPCHRVIGNSGELTGYAYGLDLKMKLLEFENPRTFFSQRNLFETQECLFSVSDHR